jgi:hypothetical protein
LPEVTVEGRAVRLTAQLRHKIESEASRLRLPLTEPGVGYRLREPD